jgi:hypothetical protein
MIAGQCHHRQAGSVSEVFCRSAADALGVAHGQHTYLVA